MREAEGGGREGSMMGWGIGCGIVGDFLLCFFYLSFNWEVYVLLILYFGFEWVPLSVCTSTFPIFFIFILFYFIFFRCLEKTRKGL